MRMAAPERRRRFKALAPAPPPQTQREVAWCGTGLCSKFMARVEQAVSTVVKLAVEVDTAC